MLAIRSGLLLWENDVLNNNKTRNPNKFESGAEGQILASQKAQTLEARMKRIKTLEGIGHQKGEKNSQYGTCWIHSFSQKKCMKVAKD